VSASVKVISLSVINTRKPLISLGLRVFFALKKSAKPTFRFTRLKQDMEKYIRIVLQKTQYLVFLLLTFRDGLCYTGKAPPFLG
jgi:hypothetical protein